ncbi:2'-5' RNA ligase [Desulfobotulus alkaliphilus]|uniref:RNA 2',3'-cyclic phosphodiesterase n=1 Tax=Desulfobotulus alkaliphilus TaxID=622671 RepID=A0A562S7S6_9BACT|nr:2'-5' RNA ligase family protein [Desulfobotulus alkaliphilus]TWI76754.1 2'-5' RNA ligase [Desulfobotulus alkaliphilus]
MEGKAHGMQRLFVALDFSGEERLRVYEAAERIRVAGAFVLKRVRHDNLHITLKFLGDTDRVEEIMQRLGQMPSVSACRLLLSSRPEYFYRSRGPVPVFLPVLDGGPWLCALQRRLCSHMDWSHDSFYPHMTLARIRRKGKGAFLPPMPDLGKNFTMNPLGFSLYSSELRPEGPVYTLLFRSAFKEGRGFSALPDEI